MTSSLDIKIAAARYRMLLERACQPGFSRPGLTDTATPRFDPLKPPKPPLGLTPAALYRGTLGDRVNEIEDAFARYRAADIDAPAEWAEERQRIGEFLCRSDEEPDALAQLDYQKAMRPPMEAAQLGGITIHKISDTVPVALAALTAAMKADPGFALSWHANIAMAFMDTWARSALSDGNLAGEPRARMHEIANKAATHFMRQAFNVDVYSVKAGTQAFVGVDQGVGDDGVATITYREASPGLRDMLDTVREVRQIINDETGIPAGAAEQAKQEPSTGALMQANYMHACRIIDSQAAQRRRELEAAAEPLTCQCGACQRKPA